MNTWSPYSQPHSKKIWDMRSQLGPSPLQPAPVGAKLGQAPGPTPCLTASPASNPQILPQEEDYGFDLEEKNKAVVVKSVQRGSLAEVRRLRGATPAPGLRVNRRVGPSSSSESPGMAVVPPGSLSSWGY